MLICVAIVATMLLVGTVVAAPLLVYSTTLATFGVAHVLSELRYVDRRFGRRLGTYRLLSIAMLLAAAVSARAAGIFHIVPFPWAVVGELSCVVALALTAARGCLARRGFAVGVAGCLGIATLAAPFDTIIALSLLHNLTPLAFLWEISPLRRRSAIMGIALPAFLGLPLLVATGLPRQALTALGIEVPLLDPLDAGHLRDHLYVYVPEPLVRASSAIDVFSAAVAAQCAHYIAVIAVLPALLASYDPAARGVITWPRGAWFAALVTGVSVFVLMRFSSGFVEARALYGIFASIHAWIEVPLIVIALTPAQSNDER